MGQPLRVKEGWTCRLDVSCGFTCVRVSGGKYSNGTEVDFAEVYRSSALKTYGARDRGDRLRFVCTLYCDCELMVEVVSLFLWVVQCQRRQAFSAHCRGCAGC